MVATIVFALGLSGSSGSAVPVTRSELSAQLNKCGVVFNVDASPPGDGVLLSADGRTIILSRNRKRHCKRMDCVADWAKKRGLKVQYGNF